MKELDEITTQKINELYSNRFLTLAKWDMVQQLTQLPFIANYQQEQIQDMSNGSSDEAMYLRIQDTGFEQ